MAFGYAGTLRTSVGGGGVTQNRAAVDTRKTSNNPQVAANNDDVPLVEDDWIDSSVGTHEPFNVTPTSDVSITPGANQRDRTSGVGSVPDTSVSGKGA